MLGLGHEEQNTLDYLFLKKRRWKLKARSSHLWALLSHGVKGAADCPPLGSVHAPSDKLVMNGVLHKYAGTRRAALARVEEHALVGLFNRNIHCEEKELSANQSRD